MVNYKNSKIYKIEAICGNSDIYIGSTTKPYLSQRMDTHKYEYKEWKAGKFTKMNCYDIFEKYGVDNCHSVLLEAFEAESKDELYAKMCHYIQTIPCINRFGQLNDTQKKEKVKEYVKDYNTRTYKCECGVQVKNQNKSRHNTSKMHIIKLGGEVPKTKYEIWKENNGR